MTVMPGLVSGIHGTREDSELDPCIGCIYVERTSYAG
jgi:hypothetical protein